MTKGQQVAKPPMPTTILEVINLAPEQLMLFSLSELEAVHSVVSKGTTKPAKAKLDLVNGIMTSKRKEEQKASAKPEAIANSAKTKGAAAAAPSKPSKPAPAGAGKPKAPVPPSAAKPATKPAAPATPPTAAKPQTPPQVKGTAAKPPKDLDSMSPEELKEYAKKLEQQSQKFPDVLSGPNSTFRRFEVADVNELGATLLANPFQVFAFMDERIDNDLTQLLIVYASDKSILAVDKNRQKETHLEIMPSFLEKMEYVEKKDKTTFTFPFAFYLKERRGDAAPSTEE